MGLALTLAAAASAGPADEADVVDAAVASKDHTTLVTALKEAGLVETLKGKGPFTVFAPTDAAFKKLGDDKVQAVLKDKELLRKILLAHVVAGKAVCAKDAAGLDGAEVNGFAGRPKGGVTIGDAKVVKADLKCSNGVIHVIDTVLIPAK